MIGARRRLFRQFLLLSLACGLVGCALLRGGPSKEISPAKQKYIDYLESYGRADWQKPEQVVQALGLTPGASVADIGAGTGYFTRRFAAIVGPTGRVDALDIDPVLLENLERRAATAKLENVHTHRVSRDDPNLEPESADLVFLCNTYSQLRDRAVYVRKIAPGLKRGGRIAVVDFQARADIPEGPAFAEKVDRDTVIEEFREAGFALEREETFLPYQYFLIFTPAQQFSFSPLVHSIGDVMHSSEADREKQWQLAALLSDYLKQQKLEDRFRRPDPRLPVTTYLLYADPQATFSIAVLVFQPHAKTAIHDHQSWVVWGTYQGNERETRYRRTDVPGKPFPRLDVAWSKVFGSGEISFIDPPPGDVHAVANEGGDVSISIHVHATDISKQARNTYDVEHQVVRSFVQTYQPVM